MELTLLRESTVSGPCLLVAQSFSSLPSCLGHGSSSLHCRPPSLAPHDLALPPLAPPELHPTARTPTSAPSPPHASSRPSSTYASPRSSVPNRARLPKCKRFSTSWRGHIMEGARGREEMAWNRSELVRCFFAKFIPNLEPIFATRNRSTSICSRSKYGMGWLRPRSSTKRILKQVLLGCV